MDNEESLKRAERIASLFVRTDQPAFKYAVEEIARELRLIAVECGWQKDEVKRLEREAKTNRKASEP